MSMLQTSGYDTRCLLSNVAIGSIDGLDTVLWCYAFATLIFAGTLSGFLPIGLFVIMCGWVLVGVFVQARSPLKIHMVSLDEHIVVIVGSIGGVLTADMGAAAAAERGLATMLVVMSLCSLLVAASMYLIARFRVARLLELIPYPVICGFMAGVAWLLFDAGVFLAVETSISLDLWPVLQEEGNLLKLVLYFAGGVGLLWFANRINASWALPVAALAIALGFYGIAWALGYSHAELVASGWLFDLDVEGGGVTQTLLRLSPGDVDVDFIVSVTPQIVTIVFITLLGAAINVSTLTAANFEVDMQSTEEMINLAGGNLLCAAVASPPGFSDAAATRMYQRFGATSRWMPLSAKLVVLIVAATGIGLVSYMPTILVGATIFLFAIQMSIDWMYENVRSFLPADYLIVCGILVIVIAFGIVAGVLAGIFATAILFVLRYSLISAVQDQYTLADHRSSVERSATDNVALNGHGDGALVFTLRGFLFFGTTNAIRDAVNQSLEQDGLMAILLDLHRVTGIDISALKAFQTINRMCESKDVELLYAAVPENALDRLVASDAVGERDGELLVFRETDLALERMEGLILAAKAERSETRSVRQHLLDLLDNPADADLLLGLMDRIERDAGEALFHQGDPDTGLFILESGSLTATIGTDDGSEVRVKKFSPGSVIGELSRYTPGQRRTATVVADSPSVLFHLDLGQFSGDTPSLSSVRSAVHELVARTLSARIDYMNRRLIKEFR